MNSWDYDVQSKEDIDEDSKEFLNPESYKQQMVDDEKTVTFPTYQEAGYASAVQFDLKMLRDQIRELKTELFWLRTTLLLGVIIYLLFAGRHV